MRTGIIVGGIAAVVLGAGYWFYRKHAARKAESKQLEDKSLSSALGISSWDYNTGVPVYIARAAKQITAATAGRRLKTHLEADGASSMMSAAATDAEGYAKAAYWLAVAARIVGSRSLAATAYAYNVKATAMFNVPFSSYKDGGIEQIAADARGDLPSDPRLKAIEVILGHHSDTQVVTHRKDAAQSPTEASAEAAVQTAKDVRDRAADPLGVKKSSIWTKLAWGAGISVAALVVLRFAFAREYHAVGALVAKKTEPKQIAGPVGETA